MNKIMEIRFTNSSFYGYLVTVVRTESVRSYLRVNTKTWRYVLKAMNSDAMQIKMDEYGNPIASRIGDRR